MATNIIVLKKPSGEILISPGVVSTLDASGFDTVTARYIAQNNAAKITQDNPPGSNQPLPIGISVTGTSKMVFMGVSDTADLPGNCCEYTMTWRGLLATITGRDEQVTQNVTVRERNFDKISGVPNVPSLSKVRLMELQTGISVRQIKTTPPSPPDTAGKSGSLHGISAPTNQYKVTNAPLTYVFPSGWVCYSWQSEQPIPGIWFVTAEYKYEFPTQSG
jgi:hypothetical protein